MSPAPTVQDRRILWTSLCLGSFLLGAAYSHYSPSLPFLTASTSSRKKRPAPDFASALSSLQSALPLSQVSQDPELLRKYGTHPGTFALPVPPNVVVFAKSKEDVVKVVKIAKEFGIVVIPLGGRTSLEGQFSVPPPCCGAGERPDFMPKVSTSSTSYTPSPSSSPSRPTIHLDVASSMAEIISVHPADFCAVVQPGVGWQSLNQHLKEQGVKQFFPVDPAPGSCFGGMVGVGGSGTNAVGYGTMRAEWISSLEVVLMDGSIIRTKGYSRARKSSTGFDVGRLFLGSEGTLGIITELTVRLAPVVPLRVALTSFPNVGKAVDAVVEILGEGLQPTSLELLDGMSIRGLNLSKILPYELPELPTVLIRISSPLDAVLDASMESVEKIVKKHGAEKLTVGKDEEENELIWKARKNQFWSQQMLIGEGCRTLITDVCVPISRLAEFIARSQEDVDKSGLLAPIVAHIGDGNVHRAILFLPPSATSPVPPEVTKLATSLSLLAISLEGTCAGEHGIGTTKRKYLKRELGDGTLEVMRKVKNVLDVDLLLNPGKVLFEDWEREQGSCDI